MAHKKRQRTKSNKWFIRVRGSYLPKTREGWSSYIPYTAYLIVTMVGALEFEQNRAYALLITMIFWIIGAIVMTEFAHKHS